MSPPDESVPTRVADESRVGFSGVGGEEEQISLFAQVCDDPVARVITDLNRSVATSLAAMARACPYTASVLLRLPEAEARRLAELTPRQVEKLAATSPFLVVASPILPVLVDQVVEGSTDAGPALFRYAMRQEPADG